MAKGQTALPEAVKIFIVQSVACFDEPSVVANAVKQEFGIVIPRQQVESHDPNKKAGKNLGKKMRAIFEETRKAFLEDTSQVAISHRAVRLRALNRMAAKAEERGNIALAAQLIEQAAKEVGNTYTNQRKHELTGKDGGPIEHLQRPLKELSDDELFSIATGGGPGAADSPPGSV